MRVINPGFTDGDYIGTVSCRCGLVAEVTKRECRRDTNEGKRSGAKYFITCPNCNKEIQVYGFRMP